MICSTCFLPQVFFLFILLVHGAGTLSVSNEGQSLQISIFEMSGVFTGLLLASVPAYIAWSLGLMGRAKRALDTVTMPARFRWIWFFIVALGFIWLLSLMAFLTVQNGGHRRDELTGADQNVQMGDVVRLSLMELGGLEYSDMSFRFNDLVGHDKQTIPMDGLLGYEFLKARPTAINFRTGELLIWPR